MDYSTFRQFADSWGLLYMFLLFIGVMVTIVQLVLSGAD